MAELDRVDMEARYELFKEFALNDQRKYYETTVRRFRKSAKQINQYRASFAFLTGLAAALAGFIVQTRFVDSAACGANAADPPGYCGTLQWAVYVFIVLSVVLPATSALFNSLADLFQWDRLITIYDASLENVEVADAQSPLPEMEDVVYRASLRAFTEGVLNVMEDETAQWGQSIRQPEQLQKFVAEEVEKAQKSGGVAAEFTPVDENAAADKVTKSDADKADKDN